MTFRARFDCLWCGDAWTTSGPEDLEGWARLCPACLGRAGQNPFLRGRLRAGMAARAARAATAASAPPEATTAPALPLPAAGLGDTVHTPPPAPAPAFPDDWFLRRGAFERGSVHDVAWAAELDMVTRWLDGLGLTGAIVEPAAGVGFFSPLLAERGDLHAFDADGEALDRARDRLVAHRLRAHLHVADPWAIPPGGVAPLSADAVVAAFLLGRVRGAGLDPAAASLHSRLRPGGRLAVIDLRPDPAGGPPAGTSWSWHAPDLIEAALRRAGFRDVDITTTGRFFLTAVATAR